MPGLIISAVTKWITDMKKLLNCWDVMRCGFGPDGDRTGRHGLCPAARETSIAGVHGGRYGGRACWFVADTFECGNGARGNFQSKYPVCMNCRFYWQVREEQGDDFEVSLLLNTYPEEK